MHKRWTNSNLYYNLFVSYFFIYIVFGDIIHDALLFIHDMYRLNKTNCSLKIVQNMSIYKDIFKNKNNVKYVIK